MPIPPRQCPHCKIVIPIDKDFSFDEKLNLICGNCNKIAFPATQDAENSSFIALPYNKWGNNYSSEGDS